MRHVPEKNMCQRRISTIFYKTGLQLDIFKKHGDSKYFFGPQIIDKFHKQIQMVRLTYS